MADAVVERKPLPIGSVDRIGLGWWGVLCVIATEGALFSYLLFAYLYTAVQRAGTWTPSERPSFRYALPLTLIVILGSVAAWWGERGARRNARGELVGGLALAVLLGLAFIALELLEWRSKPFSLHSSVYASHYFVITGVHLAHVVAGVLILSLVLLWSALGYFDSRRNAPVLIGAAYWHFVNASWIVFFLALYVAPYLE